MPVEKHKVFGTSDVMKAEDGNDSLDTIIRKAIGREPFLSVPRASDSPVQWIQLLHALDQQEPPGWPLLSPLKVQLQKCEKCSREFLSTINYRRHIRVYHRLKKIDKDSTKNRDLLGAYWDKLSVEEAKEVVSFKNVMLEEVPGSSMLKALTTLVRKQGFSSLPQNYLKAGSALLDIVQARSSILSISSKELFSILDSASEKTFLCGAAVSMQKYIFDGEPGKIGLEPKNLVACTSFLLEQKLVTAWLADKEAEALRCQKLLVEEEEAAQKRQAEILERKRQKKLRQKEQKARGQKLEDEAERKKTGSSSAADSSLAEAFLDTCDSGELNPDTFTGHGPSLPVLFHCTDANEVMDGGSLSLYGCGTDQNIEQETSQGHACQHLVVAQPKPQWAVANGFHANHNSQISKPGVIQKYGTHREQKANSMLNGNKVWSRKPKQSIIGVHSKARLEKEPDEGKNREVLIGSISVTLGNSSQSEDNLVASGEDRMGGNLTNNRNAQEKPVKPDSGQISNNRLTVKAVKLWRPVTHHGTKYSSPLHSAGPEAHAIDDQNLADQNSLRPCDLDNSDSFENNSFHLEGQVGPGNLRYSSQAAKAFLAERWKKAILSNHVKLVLSPDSEPPRCMEVQDCELAACQSSNIDKCCILASAEIRLPATSFKSKIRMKPGNGVKIKYIPKQRTAT
ncbi:uncharacterized protein LOC129293016 [Prosopis cineraria]|uniref:uncharacterized protein LOC129293016 n=1 Tax=Prosopis cineraria TaxID=364024 RepID=UPI00240F03AB|nr:uncharacterized protein LOC129293016 [Prosopis cineraria]XP_054786777.1 uncharacterized protein LOC129293016 [Prosopis cineraria]XP_054786778.1 uncharacterized protein LOC129293016 [Prosopis cineraria]XP_054786779.1 uncharacterized protein LOC129293016 [Prosopis cineraria]XP_054786780.1 uncharacterized protein LOC129293016 [Prosopis cineraria]XP_054786781.1 uncharacterized protein LOC129293016 [Prosopis cineraria]